ncbi:hypothetical protein Lste_0369 [Legionella steelei]|uniref:Uncharacterized protein n=1 Tax=Legionella steelei TaxID=947033 RepID=A0A0W0ZP86_9GAMM|nr:hypothetical protein [Legionella steelei]KTD71045.1 hypothetical protein Lste_0369 [Legionella steelei]
MPIHSFLEEEQSSVLNRYNALQSDRYKIPELLRNYHTGWPLLQVSLFSVAKDATESIKYEHVLGGGACHFFYIGAFNFASLLTKIPGSMDITTPYPITPKRELVKADNVLLFLKSFSVHHKRIGIKITSKSNVYGKSLLVDLPMGNASKFCDALMNVFSFALKKDAAIKAIGGWSSPGYTQQEIESAINPEVAVFHNGQIFIDFGMFLEQIVKDAETIELFKFLFKIEPFLELQKKYPEFKPKPLQAVVATRETPTKEPGSSISRPKTPSFFQEEKKEASIIHNSVVQASPSQ